MCIYLPTLLIEAVQVAGSQLQVCMLQAGYKEDITQTFPF